jgi:NAD(P)-dependent dehydrogenase (short-subunit alcohol dehydrogenase family)
MSKVPQNEPDYLQSLFGLERKIALVTGATGGIGQELALGLARAGARVVVSGRREEQLAEIRERIATAGGAAAVVAADVSSLEESRSMVEQAAAAFGGLDILVNCAGMNRRQPILEVEPETYEQIMAVNLRGPYFASQAAAPLLIERGGGSIVNIGSITVAIGLELVSVYGASKAALAQLTRTMAVEWAAHNIRVNCLCPGFIMTPLTAEGLWGDERKSRWLLDRIPLRRPGRPEEMVGMAVFLASDASSYMTGQSVFLDGGLLAGSPW